MTRNTASRSVKMPVSISFSITSTAPVRLPAIHCAAWLTLVSGAALSIFSPCMIVLIRWLNIVASHAGN